MTKSTKDTQLELRACAKINLSLEALGRLPDGYHQIVSVMQTIDLHDVVLLRSADELTFECDDPQLAGPGNLAWRAGVLLSDYAGIKAGAKIQLRKGIPVAAGLGGGSSDAAAVLKGLNELWGLRLGVDELAGLGSRLGLDIPFFLYGGTALAEGRGERITSLRSLVPLTMVLMRPPLFLPNKTAALYASLSPADYSDGKRTYALAEWIRQGRKVEATQLVNVFERVARQKHPVVAECLERMKKAGAEQVHLTGSGPTLFTLVQDDSTARELRGRLEDESLEAYVVHTTGD